MLLAAQRASQRGEHGGGVSGEGLFVIGFETRGKIAGSCICARISFKVVRKRSRFHPEERHASLID